MRVTVVVDLTTVTESGTSVDVATVAGRLVERLETDENLVITTTDGTTLRITAARVSRLEN